MKAIRRSAPLLPLAGALVLLFHRLLLGEVFFWGLPSLQFTPWRELATALLKGGQLPLWNALSGAGAPLLANYQSALLYPFSWPAIVLPTAWTMSVTAVLHLFIAGWGMWAFTGTLGANGLGRATSALAFGLTSYLVARTGTYPMVAAAAWLPWLMWAAHGLFGTRPMRAVFGLSAFTALLLLAGHAQIAWYSLLLAGLYVLFQAARQRKGKPLLWAAGAVSLGAAVAALQLAPTAELLLSSQRGGGVERGYALNFSYAPLRMLNIAAPLVFGSPADGSYYTNGAFFEDAVYVGLLPLIAALTAVVKWPWRRRAFDPLAGSVPFFAALIITALLLALGKYGPLFPFLFDHVPTFDLFQGPVRWHLWTAFGLAVLASIGITWWIRGGSWSRRAAALTGAALGVSLIGTLALPDAEPVMQALLRTVVVASALAFGAVLLTLIKPPAYSCYTRAWQVAVLLIAAADLVWAGWGLNPTTTASFYDARPNQAAERAFWPAGALETAMYEDHLRLNDYRMTGAQIAAYRNSGLPNLNLLDGAGLLNNFDPLLVGGHAQYMALLSTVDDTGPLLRAAGVSQVYDAQGVLQALSSGPAPLAWMVSAACYSSDEQAAQGMSDPAWSPERLVYLAGSGACEPPATAPRGEVLSISADLSVIEANAGTDGWLVVAATHYPGWHAAVDGSATPIERANLAFRAVWLTAGRHTVVFDYSPAWLPPAALLSLAGLAGLAVIFALARRERHYNADRERNA